MHYDSNPRLAGPLVLLVCLPPRMQTVTDNADGYEVFLCFAVNQVSPLLSVKLLPFHGFHPPRTTFRTDLGVMVVALGNNATDSHCSYPKFSSFS